MKTLVRPILLVAMICVLIVGISACDKNRPLTDQEKALIDKSVFDKQTSTKAEESEVQSLIQENKYAEILVVKRNIEFNMKGLGQTFNGKALKGVPVRTWKPAF